MIAAAWAAIAGCDGSASTNFRRAWAQQPARVIPFPTTTPSYPPANRHEMIAGLRAYLRSTQRQPEIVKRYFHAESVRYAD
jgi:hypothetical protein